ncbi:hypothetical protein NA57DRAFT_60422 [Rhizodiscina lignyota]|uniref:Uncharacterized protein n=1 Tax=Rhizodiscina lignyota TaxID=1504668 RepID=A0A9P4M2C1_9PEZI|nr:hypothetical protein NA57DRAFT_60422 [Rhizodiscina lignyota]
MNQICPSNSANYSLQDFKCEWLFTPNCGCPELKANPDVGGLGVIPESLPQGDRLSSRQDPWEECIQTIVAGLTDQALVTGLSVSISSLMTYANGSMDKYHFCIASSLTCFTIGVHALSIILVRSGEHEAQRGKGDESMSVVAALFCGTPYKGRRVKMAIWAWRRLCMLASLAMFSIMFAIHLSPDKQYTCPARCSFTLIGHPTAHHIVPAVVLFLAVVIVVVAVEGESTLFISKLLNYLQKRWPKWKVDWHDLFLTSLAFATFTVFFSLGIWILFGIPVSGKKLMGPWEWTEVEHSWGFGQIVPIILLMLPFMAAAEAYTESFEEPHTEGSSQPPSQPSTQPLSQGRFNRSRRSRFPKHPSSIISTQPFTSELHEMQLNTGTSVTCYEPHNSQSDIVDQPKAVSEREADEVQQESEGLIASYEVPNPPSIVEYFVTERVDISEDLESSTVHHG